VIYAGGGGCLALTNRDVASALRAPDRKFWPKISYFRATVSCVNIVPEAILGGSLGVLFKHKMCFIVINAFGWCMKLSMFLCLVCEIMSLCDGRNFYDAISRGNGLEPFNMADTDVIKVRIDKDQRAMTS
jgi:hypothetical protein